MPTTTRKQDYEFGYQRGYDACASDCENPETALGESAHWERFRGWSCERVDQLRSAFSAGYRDCADKEEAKQ